MQNKFYLFILGITLWSGFGAIIGSFSANLLSYTWILQATGFGTAIGLLVGFIIGLAGLSASSRFRVSIMLWMLAGSLIGASVKFKGIIPFGGYPNGSQADLSFIILALMGLANGTVFGTTTGLLLWKYRHRAAH